MAFAKIVSMFLLFLLGFLAAGSALNLSRHPHWFVRAWDFPRVQIISISWILVIGYFALRLFSGPEDAGPAWPLVMTPRQSQRGCTVLRRGVDALPVVLSRLVRQSISVDREPCWPIFDHRNAAPRAPRSSGTIGTPIASPRKVRSLPSNLGLSLASRFVTGRLTFKVPGLQLASES
jgi:hypothetical protein